MSRRVGRWLEDILKAQETRKTGIGAIGDVPWGTHLCQFYQTKEDLIDILVPYFKAGLENNEYCMWVTAEPLGVGEAKAALKSRIRNLDSYIREGRLEILDCGQWYTKTGEFDARTVLKGWIEKEKKAIENGFAGLRLNGNTSWLAKRDWKAFAAYEETVNNVIHQHKMIAICSYSLEKMEANEIIDVVSNHRFALIRRRGKWIIIESGEHKRMEESLRANAERYHQLVEGMHDGLMQVDNQDRILFVNNQLCKMLGYTRNALLGRIGCRMLFDKEGQKLIKCYNARRLRKLTDTYETMMKKRSGKLMWVQISGSPVVDRHGGVLGSIGLVADIHERKKAEANLHHAMSELETERQKMTGLAQKIMEAQEKERRYLAASVHDELLQSLVAVLYFLQLIDVRTLDGDIQKQKERLLEIIEISIAHGRELIQEMEPIGHPQLDIVRAIKKYVDTTFAKSDVKVSVIGHGKLPPTGLTLKTNVLRIAQEALMNVRKHARATKVSVRALADNGRLEIKIRDNGVGFTPRIVVGSIVGHYGLLIMRERARLVGGEVKVISQPNKGTTVSASFPLKIKEPLHEED